MVCRVFNNDMINCIVPLSWDSKDLRAVEVIPLLLLMSASLENRSL